MHAFYFGTSDHQLFGIYQEPARGQGRTGVVLCYPWGQEYLRAHRAFQFLGGLVAGVGLHVLRFDYFGTGDSAGDLGEADPPAWKEDIITAVEELTDMGDLHRVALCGLRMGAYWAAEAASGLGEVDRLVLWDPVVDGAAYVREVMARAARQDGRTEADGFVVTGNVRDALSACSQEAFPDVRVPALVVQTREQAAVNELVTRLEGTSPSIASRTSPGPVAWEEEVGDFGTSGMPVPTLQGIAEWLRGS